MSIEREIGAHDEAIETLKKDVSQMKTDLSEIKDLLAGARGGWKTLVWVAGLASAAGAAAAKVVAWWGH